MRQDLVARGARISTLSAEQGRQVESEVKSNRLKVGSTWMRLRGNKGEVGKRAFFPESWIARFCEAHEVLHNMPPQTGVQTGGQQGQGQTSQGQGQTHSTLSNMGGSARDIVADPRNPYAPRGGGVAGADGSTGTGMHDPRNPYAPRS